LRESKNVESRPLEKKSFTVVNTVDIAKPDATQETIRRKLARDYLQEKCVASVLLDTSSDALGVGYEEVIAHDLNLLSNGSGQ
tara:strand:+ start:359 stop:607 length:249 start_codon:yes stop_codon:yes gene_type:complete